MELGLRAAAIELTTVKRELLNQISNGRTSERAHAKRAEIILLCAEGKTNYRIGKELGISEEVETICAIYGAAAALHAAGVHVVSCDEKTGIQAIERES